MAASVGTESGPSVNVELNIVPFIDLMSCLTAFLLVTAVWVNIAEVKVTPHGRGRDVIDPPENPQLALLVSADRLWLGVSRVDDRQTLPRGAGGHDWDGLAEALRRERAPGGFFEHDQHLELAIESTDAGVVPYQDMIRAMDVATAAGFTDVQLTDVRGLPIQPDR